MNIKKIFLITSMCVVSSQANAVDYNIGHWNFRLDADGMVGFLEPRNDAVIFINDWDVKGQISY